MTDIATIRSELEDAGFSRIYVETVEHRIRAQFFRDPVIGYCQGTPLRNEIVERDPSRLEEATDAAARAISERFGTGTVDGKIKAHGVMATF
jgi:hypothetical protein